MRPLHLSVLSALTLFAAGAVVGFWGGRISNVNHSLSPESVSLARFTGGPLQVAKVSPGNEPFSAVGEPSFTAGWAERWGKLVAAVPTPKRDRDMTAALEALARFDPRRATSIAQGEPNLLLRNVLLQAVLRIWAEADAPAAASWVLAQKEGDRSQAILTVLKAAAGHPQGAVELARRLAQDDPSHADEYSATLMNALDEAGEFKLAADVAAQSDPHVRGDLLTLAFSNWGKYQAQIASQAAAQLTDSELRKVAEQAVISGWSEADPKGLANFAAQMPKGEFRTLAMTEALQTWVLNDPAHAAEWMDRFEANPELDAGVMAVATLPSLVRHPDVALSWAETISDASARSRTVQEIVEEWARFDPDKARRYAETTLNLNSEDRASLLQSLTSAP